MSITDMNKVVRTFRDKFGSEWFQHGIGKTISEGLTSMHTYTETSRIAITDSKGNLSHIVISHVNDLDKFIKDMCEVRQIAIGI